VCRSYERIDDFRAKLLGFLPLVSGTGLFFLVERANTNVVDRGSPEFLVPAGIFGLVVTLGLLLYELRGIQRCIRLATVAYAFEGQMGVEGRFRRWPHSVGRFINEPIAAALIYPGVLAAWMFLAVISVSLPYAIISASVVLCVGFGAVWGFYRYVTPSEEWQRIVDDVQRTHSGQPKETIRCVIMERLATTGLKVDAKMVTAMTETICNRQRFQVELGGRWHVVTLTPPPSTRQITSETEH
jgi:hypothetical protein